MSKKIIEKNRHEKKTEILKDHCVWEMRAAKDMKPHLGAYKDVEHARYTANGHKRIQFQPNTHKAYKSDNRQNNEHYGGGAINVNIGEGEFVLFDDIEANWSVNAKDLKSRRQKQQQYNEYTQQDYQQQKPMYQQQLKHHHQDMLKMTKMIGHMPIAEYEGSPRRFGNQPNSIRTTTTAAMLGKRAPGFPQRVSSKIDNQLLQQVTEQAALRQKQASVVNLIDIDDEQCAGAVGGQINADKMQVLEEFFEPHNELHAGYRKYNNADMERFYVPHVYHNYDQAHMEEKQAENYIGQRLAQLPQSEMYLVHQSPVKQVNNHLWFRVN